MRSHHRDSLIPERVIFGSILVVLFFANVRGNDDGEMKDSPANRPREQSFVGTVLIDTIGKYTSITAGGDLSVNIPLFQVPGPLPVGLDLAYQSGIKLDQDASWVGLGWNLGNWSVKRRAVNGDDVYFPVSWSDIQEVDPMVQSRYNVNDLYDVSIPGRDFTFINVGTQDEPNFVPANYSNDSLYAQMEFVNRSSDAWMWEYSRITYLILTDGEANQYVFAKPMLCMPIGSPYKEIKELFLEHDMVQYPEPRPEYGEWLLTAILSHDYCDAGGNPLNPIDVSPLSNKGWWVSFVYTGDGATENTSRFLEMGPLRAGIGNQEGFRDSTEVAFLKKIVSPTTVVTFDLREPSNYQTVRYYRSDTHNSAPPLMTKKDLVLAKIRVNGYSGNGTTCIGPELWGAVFNYEPDYTDDPLKEEWAKSFYDDAEIAQSQLDGEPTLRSISIGTGLTYQSPYRNAVEVAESGIKRRFTFDYDEYEGEYFYANRFDKYSNWSYGEDDTRYHYLSAWFPFSPGHLTTQSWVRNTGLEEFAWGYRDFFGYDCRRPQALSLTDMTTPEGLHCRYIYEPDQYRIDNSFDWVGGGCRVAKILISPDPSPNRNDYLQTDTISLAYGNDGYGRPTSMPATFDQYYHQYSSIEQRCPLSSDLIRSSSLCYRFYPDNASHSILYPQITWRLPSRGSIEYHYRGLSQTELDRTFSAYLGTYSNSVFKCIEFELYARMFSFHAPKQGRLFRTVIRNAHDQIVYSREDAFRSDLVTQNDIPSEFEGSFSAAAGAPNPTGYCSWFLGPYMTTVFKDGVTTKTEYNYDSHYRLTEEKVTAHAKSHINRFTYASDTNPGMRSRHYLAAPSSKIGLEIVEDTIQHTKSWTNYSYAQSFPGWQVPGVYRLRQSEEIVAPDLDILAADVRLITTYEDYDRFGRPSKILSSSGPRQTTVSSRWGVESIFENAMGNEYAAHSAEDALVSQPNEWSFSSPNVTMTSEDAFSGYRSFKCLPGSVGPSVTLASLNAGTYIAEGWLRGPNASTARFTLEARSGGQTVTSSFKTGIDDAGWQHLVCSLQVGVGQSLTFSCSSGNSAVYFDDLRVYRVTPDTNSLTGTALVTSYAYDPAGRVLSESDYNNYPTRYFFDRYSELSAIADHANSPARAVERFNKVSEIATGTLNAAGLRYHPSFPNAEFSFECLTGGLIEDFRNNPLLKYEINGTQLPVWDQSQQRLSFTVTDDCTEFCDLVIPVDQFSNGFLALDVIESRASDTGSHCPEISGDMGTNVLIGFERSDGQGYTFGLTQTPSAPDPFDPTRYQQISVMRYSGTQYLDPVRIDGSGYAIWNRLSFTPNPYRIMFGRMGDYLFVFYNNDCVWMCQDDSYDDFERIRIRLKHPGAYAQQQLTTSIDNLLFLGSPVVTADFIDEFGIRKQQQTFDGNQVSIAGNRHTLDGKSEATFLPVQVPVSSTYGTFAGADCEASPFDYISNYAKSASGGYMWNPSDSNSVLSTTSFLYSYLGSEPGVDPCRNGTDFVPFAFNKFSNDPLRRLVCTQWPGQYASHPLNFGFGSYASFLPGFDTTAYGLDSVSMQRTADENGKVVVSLQDKFGATIAEIADSAVMGINAYTKMHREFNGNIDTLISPEGQISIRKYWSNGWLVWDSSGDYGIAQRLYDKSGNLRFLMSATDRDSSRFHYTKYDAFSRPIEQGVYTDPSHFQWFRAVVVGFPSQSNPEQAAHMIITARYEYDSGNLGRGQLTRAVKYHYPGGYPDTASFETFEYDEDGNLVRTTQFVDGIDDTQPRVIGAQYNQASQPTKITYPNGTFVEYWYDLAGRLNLMTAANGILASYEYWPNDKVKTRRLYAGLSAIQELNYRYNSRGWLVAINDSTLSASDRFGLYLDYDSNGYGGLNIEGEWQYPREYYNGNVASYRIWAKTPTGTRDSSRLAFRYDGLDRLVETENRFGGTTPPLERFSYDRNGNLLTDTLLSNPFTAVGNQGYSYYPGTNRLREVSGQLQAPGQLEYTPSGSVSSLGANQPLGYDYDEQLCRRQKSGAHPTEPNTVDFRYNTAGQRVAKEYRYYYSYYCGPDTGIEFLGTLPPGDSLEFSDFSLWPDTSSSQMLVIPSDSLVGIYDIPGQLSSQSSSVPGGEYCIGSRTVRTGYYYFGDQLMCEYDGPGSNDLLANYVWANGEKIARMTSGGPDVRYYLNDHLGSPIATISPTGTVKDLYFYSDWGKTQRSVTTEPQPVNFTGQLRDEELGYELLYYGSRYYDSHLKRFLSVDPQADKFPGWGPYTYCADNPVKYVDPSGEILETLWDGFNVALDLQMLAEDLRNGNWYHAAADLGALVVDGAATLLPGVPAGVGAIRKSARTADNVADAAKMADVAVDAAKATDAGAGATRASQSQKAMAEGRMTEKALLEQEGLAKNTTPVPATDTRTGFTGTTIPDHLTAQGGTVEVKSGLYITHTRQLRLQTAHSMKYGQRPVLLLTNPSARVSQQVKEFMDVRYVPLKAH